MKITIIFSLLCLFGIVIFPVHASDYKCLVLWHANGSQTAVGLYKEPRLTFDAKSLIIHSPVLEMTFPKSEILKYTFEDKEEGTAVGTVREDRLDFQVTSSSVIVKGGIKNAPVSLYDMSGKVVPITVYPEGEGFQIPLSSVAKGVYILSVGSQTFKFSKL